MTKPVSFQMIKSAQEQMKLPQVCVIGIGNPLRSDDGVADYMCSLIEDNDLGNVSVIRVQQLQTDLIESLLKFEVLVFVDASLDGADFQFYELNESNFTSYSSHHLGPELLASLARQLFGKHWTIRICAIRGYRFQIGDQLSAGAFQNAHKALSYLKSWIDDACC
jgi:hydrogenase maturation protease